MTFGAKTSSATAPPAHSHGFRNCLRELDAARPTTNAKPNASVECLFISPKPATSPNASHIRDSPYLSTRTTMYAHATQTSGSNVFIVRIVLMLRKYGATMTE